MGPRIAQTRRTNLEDSLFMILQLIIKLQCSISIKDKHINQHNRTEEFINKLTDNSFLAEMGKQWRKIIL